MGYSRRCKSTKAKKLIVPTPIKLKARAQHSENVTDRVLARVTSVDVGEERRCDYVRLVDKNTQQLHQSDIYGYLGLLVAEGAESLVANEEFDLPILGGYKNFDWIKDDSIVSFGSSSPDVNVLYRPESFHNTIFSTGRCNSNCVMCSQPPVIRDDNSIVSEHLRS